MATQPNIPYPDAQTPDDVLTDDQKQAIFRINTQNIIKIMEEGPRDTLMADNWNNILKANLPGVKQAVLSNILTQEWTNRANVLLQRHQALLEQPAG